MSVHSQPMAVKSALPQDELTLTSLGPWNFLMKSLRNFLRFLVFSSAFLILSCASDQTPAKVDSTKNTADVLNKQISIELNSQKATWVDSLVPSTSVVASSQSNLNLEPGNSLKPTIDHNTKNIQKEEDSVKWNSSPLIPDTDDIPF